MKYIAKLYNANGAVLGFAYGSTKEQALHATIALRKLALEPVAKVEVTKRKEI